MTTNETNPDNGSVVSNTPMEPVSPWVLVLIPTGLVALAANGWAVPLLLLGLLAGLRWAVRWATGE